MTNYKNCFIFGCRNTTITTPNKIFVTVPTKKEERKKWMKAARRNDKDISAHSHIYCCEDHFDLEQDMENYLEFKVMGVRKRMKKGVVPHIFSYQINKKKPIYSKDSIHALVEKKSTITRDETPSNPPIPKLSLIRKESIVSLKTEIKVEEHDFPEIQIKEEIEDSLLIPEKTAPNFEFVNIKELNCDEDL